MAVIVDYITFIITMAVTLFIITYDGSYIIHYDSESMAELVNKVNCC